MFTIADWAWKSEKLHEHDPKMWYVFVEEIDERSLVANGFIGTIS
jgi:hypothetical protein